MLKCRSPTEFDWSNIARLASNDVQQGDHSGSIDADWIANRRSSLRIRRDFVLEKSGGVVAYGAIERQASEPQDHYRVFLVTDWRTVDDEIKARLYEETERLLVTARANKAWMRELAGDVSLLRFVEQHGFKRSQTYRYGRHELVNLTKNY